MISLDFSKEHILENEVVRLSPLKIEHLAFLLPLAKDPTIWTYFLEKGNDLPLLTDYFKHALQLREANKEYPFIIYDKRKKQYAGTTRFYEYSAEIKTIKLGHTWYGTAFQGTGLNKNCKYLLFEFAFEQLAVERIGFGSYSTNKRSIAAMESVGCKKEGILRNMFPAINGTGRTDAILLSMLKNEWFDYAKANLKNKLTAHSS